MKKQLFLGFALLLCLITTSCKDDDYTVDMNQLTGKWVSTGYEMYHNGKKMSPQDFSIDGGVDSYDFAKDGTVTVSSSDFGGVSHQTITGTYQCNYSKKTVTITYPAIYYTRSEQAQTWEHTLKVTSLTDSQLILSQGDKGNEMHSIFKRVVQSD